MDESFDIAAKHGNAARIEPLDIAATLTRAFSTPTSCEKTSSLRRGRLND
jgi:hypothetical protein